MVRIIRIILTIKINLMMLSTVSYLFWKCLFFPGSDLSKKVINRSLNGVSNTQGKPINITGADQPDNDVSKPVCANHYSGKTQKPQK